MRANIRLVKPHNSTTMFHADKCIVEGSGFITAWGRYHYCPDDSPISYVTWAAHNVETTFWLEDATTKD